MTARVSVKPELLRWAFERAGQEVGAYKARFPHLEGWLRGETLPTLRQLESVAKTTHTPIGYLFLEEPPEERVPIPDFRTLAGRHAMRPSADLLETIYVCQQRQEWYRDFARAMGESPRRFVGSARVTDDVVATAARMSEALGFDLLTRSRISTWTDALRDVIEKADTAGIMVMCSGVVLNNNRRHLDPGEFRGFAISDDLAPLVFINGADTKAAQMFTLAHELAHVWLGQSALSDVEASWISTDVTERWCNRVAAELLVPLRAFRGEYRRANDLGTEINRLARHFKVSTLVILRRIHDAGGLSWERLQQEYDQELQRLRAIPRGSGGNFYLTQAARVSKRFARALVVSTWEGRSSFSEAFRLLGVKKMETFRGMSHSLGFTV